ncbi:TPA: type IV toxin-antitoxin system AbiEi family antitoxin domain-containing protein [Enterobacter cancerogenus]
MSSKINWLLQNTAPGDLILQSWLSENNISPPLAAKYVKSRWLTKLRSGVYFRTGREPNWSDALWCLQNQLKAKVFLASITSLLWQGRSHYLQLTEKECWLSAESKTVLPKWFKEFVGIQWRIVPGQKLSAIENNFRTELIIKQKKIHASGPELAAYELLCSVPLSISFEHAAELFQGLVNLNPRKVEALLMQSQSVQVKRLYLFLSDFYEHSWLKRVDISKIDLGSGKRQIIAGGKLDSRYQITVPEPFSVKRMSHG